MDTREGLWFWRLFSLRFGCVTPLERSRPFSACLHDVCRAVVALGGSEGVRCRGLAHTQSTALSVQGALYHSSPLRACSCCSLALLPVLIFYLVVKRRTTFLIDTIFDTVFQHNSIGNYYFHFTLVCPLLLHSLKSTSILEVVVIMTQVTAVTACRSICLRGIIPSGARHERQLTDKM
eukprot:21498-Heterococcus_DN1.PRE.1